MHIAAYKKEDSDEILEDCIRLKCGHAFHGTCVALAFRNAPECPVCRDSPHKQFEEAFENVIQEINARVSEVDASLLQTQYIQSHHPKVQNARRLFNLAKADFQKEIKDLETKRHALLAKVLKDFRQDTRDKFQDTQKKVQRQLTKVRSAEWHALCEIYGETEAKKTLELLDRSGAYSVRHLLGHQEIFRKRFWSL